MILVTNGRPYFPPFFVNSNNNNDNNDKKRRTKIQDVVCAQIAPGQSRRFRRRVFVFCRFSLQTNVLCDHDALLYTHALGPAAVRRADNRSSSRLNGTVAGEMLIGND